MPFCSRTRHYPDTEDIAAPVISSTAGAACATPLRLGHVDDAEPFENVGRRAKHIFGGQLHELFVGE